MTRLIFLDYDDIDEKPVKFSASELIVITDESINGVSHNQHQLCCIVRFKNSPRHPHNLVDQKTAQFKKKNEFFLDFTKSDSKTKVSVFVAATIYFSYKQVFRS